MLKLPFRCFVPKMEPQARVAMEELMRRNGPGLAAQEPVAEGFWGFVNGVSRPLRELVSTLCYMEADFQAGGDVPGVTDRWDFSVYHALFISHLSTLAEHAHPADGTADDEATRIACLQEKVQKYTDGTDMQLPYTIVGLCYANVSPATLVQHQDTLYVAFKNSHAPHEWRADFQFSLRNVRDVQGLPNTGRVHEGFLQAYQGLRENVVTRIAFCVQNTNVRNVVLCGHSLGGAIAQLLRKTVAENTDTRVTSRVVSFGCPRICDADFRNALGNFHHIRLYVRKDPFAALRLVNYGPHCGSDSNNVEGWKLGRRREAVARSADDPNLDWRWPALVFTRHRLTTYAAALKDHRELREGSATLSERAVATFA